MKKLISIILCIAALSVFAACNNGNTDTDETKKPADQTTQAESTDSATNVTNGTEGSETNAETDAETDAQTEPELTPQELIANALSKRDAYSSYKYDANIVMSVFGEEMKVLGTEMFINKNGSISYATYSVDEGGEQSDGTFYRDGVIYTTVNYEECCGKLSTKEFLDYFKKSSAMMEISSLLQSCTEFTAEKGENGTLTVKSSEMDFTSLSEIMGIDNSDIAGMDMQVDGSVAVTIDANGDAVSEVFDITFKMGQAGITVEMPVKITSTLSQINSLTSITFDEKKLKDYEPIQEIGAFMELCDISDACYEITGNCLIEYKLDVEQMGAHEQKINVRFDYDEEKLCDIIDIQIKEKFTVGTDSVTSDKSVFLSPESSYITENGVKTDVEYDNDASDEIMSVYTEYVFGYPEVAQNIKITSKDGGKLYTFDIDKNNETNVYIFLNNLTKRSFDGDIGVDDITDKKVDYMKGEILVDADGNVVYYKNSAKIEITADGVTRTVIYETKVSPAATIVA